MTSDVHVEEYLIKSTYANHFVHEIGMGGPNNFVDHFIYDKWDEREKCITIFSHERVKNLCNPAKPFLCVLCIFILS